MENILIGKEKNKQADNNMDSKTWISQVINGKIVLPDKIIDKMDLHKGDKINFILDDENNLTIRKVKEKLICRGTVEFMVCCSDGSKYDLSNQYLNQDMVDQHNLKADDIIQYETDGENVLRVLSKKDHAGLENIN